MLYRRKASKIMVKIISVISNPFLSDRMKIGTSAITSILEIKMLMREPLLNLLHSRFNSERNS